jgi:DNA polymerase-3 subunit chi
MTRVDFYVLQTGAEQQRAVFACRLAEKAHRHGLGIHIHTSGPAATDNLDKLLWTFRDGSFLPHLPVDEASEADPDGITKIHVGHGDSSGPTDGLLINIGEDVPLFFSRFDRVAEIVGTDSSERERARERFRFYRDRGYTLNTHKL